MLKNNEYIQLLESKKQIILYGPPGTGKTYSARMLATEFLTRKQITPSPPPLPKPPVDTNGGSTDVISDEDSISDKIVFTTNIPTYESKEKVNNPQTRDKLYNSKTYHGRALLIMMGHNKAEIKSKTDASSEMINRLSRWIITYKDVYEWDENGTGKVLITEGGANILKNDGLVSAWDADTGDVWITEYGRKVMEATKLNAGWYKSRKING